MEKDNQYEVADISLWNGRIDGEDPFFTRWHQIINFIDLNHKVDLSDTYVFLGFNCDEGVRRNQGRVGAKDGANAIRRVLAGLPVHFDSNLKIVDAGDIYCHGSKLEEAQDNLAEAVATIINNSGFPILLGGGHEITYGHYKGLKKVLEGSIGIINIDAHLDIRETQDGLATSGTGFYQILNDCKNEWEDFKYLAIGIQQISNTQGLFKYAKESAVEIIENTTLNPSNLKRVLSHIKAFSSSVDHVYLTIDLDAFAAPYAPGVSALAFNGIIPDDTFYQLFKTLVELPNLKSVDIAELNPVYDIDNRTAKLAADLIFKLLQGSNKKSLN